MITAVVLSFLSYNTHTHTHTHTHKLGVVFTISTGEPVNQIF